MRKLIALLFVAIFFSSPFIALSAEIHFDSLVIENGLFEKQSFDQQRNQLLNELINQLHLYEQYLGKSKTAPGIKVVMSGNSMPDFNPDKPLVSKNTIYLIQTSDDQSFLSKFNTIFEQLILINYPKADKDAVSIITLFLKYKHFNVNISKLAGLYRFCFPNQNLHEDPLKNSYSDNFSQSVKMLAASKLNELDTETNTDFKIFLRSCLDEGFLKACPKYFMDFPEFIRSVKTSLPNMKTVDVLVEAEDRRAILLSSMHIKPTKQDIQIRLDSFKDLDHALLFIAQGDNVKSKLMLDRVDVQLENVASVERFWWLMLSLMVLSVMACFLYVHNRLILRNAVVSWAKKDLAKVTTRQDNLKKVLNEPSDAKPLPAKPAKTLSKETTMPVVSTIETIEEQKAEATSLHETATELTAIETKTQPDMPKSRRKKAVAGNDSEETPKIMATKKSLPKTGSTKSASGSKTSKKTDTKRKTSK